MKTTLIFFFAVLSEVSATTPLKFPDGFAKLISSLIVVVGYGLSFYLLSISLKVMPIGIAYTLWSGTGITLTVIAGKMIWHEALDWAGERLRCSRSLPFSFFMIRWQLVLNYSFAR